MIKSMMASQMIAILQRAIDDTGDVPVVISAKDSFSRYGNDATINPIDMNSGVWSGVRRHSNHIQFDAHICDNYDGKRAKITFRK